MEPVINVDLVLRFFFSFHPSSFGRSFASSRSRDRKPITQPMMTLMILTTLLLGTHLWVSSDRSNDYDHRCHHRTVKGGATEELRRVVKAAIK